MNHNDDAYATMLLTMALSPNREEYAHPYSVQEFQRLQAAIRAASLRGPGKLLGVDISGLMSWLNLSEEEGYRVFTLLNRTVQLSYALEGYMRDGIEVVTQYDADYPRRIRSKLGVTAPAFFYRAGRAGLLERPAIAAMGISGVKTSQDARANVERLVQLAYGMGYALVTGGELGISRVAAQAAEAHGVPVIDILAGGLNAHLSDPAVAEGIAAGRRAVVSLEHPEAMPTVSHAAARNRLVFALSNAAFVFNTDGRRGEGEALAARYCDWVYAWEGYAGNAPLVSRGAIPFRDISALDEAALRRNWDSSRAEQMNFFDLL